MAVAIAASIPVSIIAVAVTTTCAITTCMTKQIAQPGGSSWARAAAPGADARGGVCISVSVCNDPAWAVSVNRQATPQQLFSR